MGSEISGFELFELFELGLKDRSCSPQPFAQVLMPTNDAFAALGNGVITSMVLAPNLEKLRQATGETGGEIEANWKRIANCANYGVFFVKHDFKIVVFFNHSVKEKWNIVQTLFNDNGLDTFPWSLQEQRGKWRNSRQTAPKSPLFFTFLFFSIKTYFRAEIVNKFSLVFFFFFKH